MATTGILDDTPPVRRRKPFLLRRKTLRHILPWVVILGIFLIWEAVVRAFEIEQFVLPAPSAIFGAVVEFWRPLLRHSLVTLWTTVTGFAR